MLDNFKGKRIVFVDDLIVRGNIILFIIKLFKEFGVKEVYIWVVLLLIKYLCFMGINIFIKEEFIVNKLEFDYFVEYLGVNSVVYLLVEGLVLFV